MGEQRDRRAAVLGALLRDGVVLEAHDAQARKGAQVRDARLVSDLVAADGQDLEAVLLVVEALDDGDLVAVKAQVRQLAQAREATDLLYAVHAQV